jgi:enoyl-CoA hydratase/carnithine racemase
MTYEFVDVKHNGRITVVTLNRPNVMNALHKPAHFELHEVFNGFAADPNQWVAVITGAGDRAFCAGNDLKWRAASVAGIRAALAD